MQIIESTKTSSYTTDSFEICATDINRFEEKTTQYKFVLSFLLLLLLLLSINFSLL
jgi:hypothetical protein